MAVPRGAPFGVGAVGVMSGMDYLALAHAIVQDEPALRGLEREIERELREEHAKIQRLQKSGLFEDGQYGGI
jgi:hypothetical protein